MKEEQPCFPRECNTDGAALHQGSNRFVKNTDLNTASTEPSQPQEKVKRMPVFGSFPGPPADLEVFSQEHGVDYSEGAASLLQSDVPKATVQNPAANFSSEDVKPSSNDNEHGPPFERLISASGLDPSDDQCLSPSRDKSHVNNEDKNFQDSAGSCEQTLACSLIQTDASNGFLEPAFFVPPLLAGPQQNLVQPQRNGCLDHTVGSGTADPLDRHDIDFTFPPTPHGSQLVECQAPPSANSNFGSRPEGPRRQMCQDYKSSARCALPMQLCSPSTSSLSSTVFSPRSTPSTTTTFQYNTLQGPFIDKMANNAGIYSIIYSPFAMTPSPPLTPPPAYQALPPPPPPASPRASSPADDRPIVDPQSRIQADAELSDIIDQEYDAIVADTPSLGEAVLQDEAEDGRQRETSANLFAGARQCTCPECTPSYEPSPGESSGSPTPSDASSPGGVAIPFSVLAKQYSVLKIDVTAGIEPANKLLLDLVLDSEPLGRAGEERAREADGIFAGRFGAIGQPVPTQG